MVLKKVNLYLGLKGITLVDVFRACDSSYKEVVSVESYMGFLNKVGVKLTESEEQLLSGSLASDRASK